MGQFFTGILINLWEAGYWLFNRQRLAGPCRAGGLVELSSITSHRIIKIHPLWPECIVLEGLTQLNWTSPTLSEKDVCPGIMSCLRGPQQRLKLLLCSILCNANLIRGHIIHAQCPQTPSGHSFLMAPPLTLKTHSFDVATMTLRYVIHELVPPESPPNTHTFSPPSRSLYWFNKEQLWVINTHTHLDYFSNIH